MGNEKRIEGFFFDQFFEDLLRDFEIRHLRIDLDSSSRALSRRRSSLG